MKKRRLWIFMLCILPAILTACSRQSQYPTDDTYHSETDFQYTWYPQGLDRNFAESEKGYYFNAIANSRSYLFYIDKETMQTVPLCGKPNCLHYDETDEDRILLCNALLQGSGTVFYSGKKLYVITGSEEEQGREALYAFDEDGSSRRELFQVPHSSPDRLAVHRGKLYIGLNTYLENMGSQISILAYDLDSPDREPETIYKQDFADATTMMDIVCYGNHLYFNLASSSMSDVFYEVNLQTHRAKEIFPYEGKEGEYYHYKTVVWDNRLISQEAPLYDSGREEKAGVILLADLDGENVERGMEIWSGPYTADDRYLYRWTMFSGVPLTDQPTFQVYDRDENLVAQMDLTRELTDYRQFYVSPGEDVFVVGDGRLYYFTKEEIASGSISPKLLLEDENIYMRW